MFTIWRMCVLLERIRSDWPSKPSSDAKKTQSKQMKSLWLVNST